KLLPVFDNAMVKTRQLVKDKQWYGESHTFAETNAAYIDYAINLSLKAIDRCLQEARIGEKRFKYNQIDAIIFVSSTGIATPSLDAYLMNERSFREDVVRLPIWGLGCAGGAMGLSRGFEWFQTNRDKSALVMACDLCSLTFQREDNKLSNLVCQALVGDAVEDPISIGDEFSYPAHRFRHSPIVYKTSSRHVRNKLDVDVGVERHNAMIVLPTRNLTKRIPGL